jgi:diguanylate cyclase (GGDEF)-like protein
MIEGITLSITPAIPFVITFIKHNIKKVYAIIFSLPFIFNVVINIVSIFYPIVFDYTPDKELIEKSLFFVPGTVGVFGLIILIVYTYIDFDLVNKIDLVAYCIFFIFGGISYLIEKLVSLYYLFYNVLALSILAYYCAIIMIENQKDTLSGVYNRFYFDCRLKNISSRKNVLIILYDCNDLKSINDTKGHAYGDEMINIIGQNLLKVYGKFGEIYRYGGDEFVVIIYKDKYFQHVDRLSLDFQNRLTKYELKMACGMIKYHKDENIEDVFKKVDQIMYMNKKILKTIND